MSIYSLMEKKN